jgi:hypothetical protein
MSSPQTFFQRPRASAEKFFGAFGIFDRTITGFSAGLFFCFFSIFPPKKSAYCVAVTVHTVPRPSDPLF